MKKLSEVQKAICSQREKASKPGNSGRYVDEVDEFGADDVAFVLKESELYESHQPLDFWALSADVQEKIAEALDEIEESFIARF